MRSYNHILEDGEVVVYPIQLESSDDSTLCYHMGFLAGYVFSLKDDIPARWLKKTRYQIESSCFPSTIGANDANYLLRMNRQIKIADRTQPFKVLGQLSRFKHLS
jgi:hypothetical protein